MSRSKQQVPMVPVTAEHRALFAREAPAVLARRGGDWLTEQAWGAGEPALTAIVSLVGLLLFDWSAPGVLAFSLACIWMGTLCDALKLVLAHGAVQRDAATWNEDRLFWGIADAIRRGRNEMRADTITPYRPKMGLFIDFVFGGIGTAVLVATMQESPLALVEALRAEAGVRIALLATLGLQLAATLATIVRHRLPGARTPMRFGAGARGLGLFLVMFVALMAGDGETTARSNVIVMNVALLALAVLSAWGVTLLRRENDWLRAQLRKTNPP